MGGVARTVERLLVALGHGTVDVFGVSLGGAVAEQLAHELRTGWPPSSLTGPGLGGVPGSPRVLWTLATPRRFHRPDYYRRVAADIHGGLARRDPDALLHGSPARFTQRSTMRGDAAQLYSVAGWTSVPWLHRLRRPTLVLAGDDDPIVPLINGRILAWLIRTPPAGDPRWWAPVRAQGSGRRRRPGERVPPLDPTPSGATDS